MLRGVRGVTEASASYAESRVAVAFDERLISEDALKQFIGSCGFSAA
jgi:copper chaperone CopZ